MTFSPNETHDPKIQSWVESANDPQCGFPIQNLPFGVFRRRGTKEPPRMGVAIGDQILDLAACAADGSLVGVGEATARGCQEPGLNGLMGLGQAAASELRGFLHVVLAEGDDRQGTVRKNLASMAEAELFVPAHIGGYTDFYASIHHATNVGRLFRPENPLLPNYKHVPIAYHGRASSIVVSGSPVVRPQGQQRSGENTPTYGPSRRLDYELETGFYIGTGNALGTTIPIAGASEHIFGVCLLNDWSAPDNQAWEYH